MNTAGLSLKRPANVVAWVSVVCAFICTDFSLAGPVIYQATGSKSDIQPAIGQFKHDILFGVGNSVPPSKPGNYTEVNFDSLNASSTTMTPRQPIETQGLYLSAPPGMMYRLSAGIGGTPQSNFGDLNSTYSEQLRSFSEPSILALWTPALSGGASMSISRPSGINAFGAVFIDVDAEASAYIFLGGLAGGLGRSFSVPANPGIGNFSFLGVIFDGGEEAMFAGVQMTSLPDIALPFEEGPLRDIVAMDNFIIGRALVVPEPSSLALWVLASAVVLGRFWWRFRA